MKYVTADEAVKLVRSGDTVCCQGGASVPVLLQEALARRHAELRNVTITSGFNVHKEPAPFCKEEYKDSFLVNSIFITHFLESQNIEDLRPCHIPRVRNSTRTP